jgi:hypothetical protein
MEIMGLKTYACGAFAPLKILLYAVIVVLTIIHG